MSTVPPELKYTSSHEWIRIEADGTATMGITDHAQELLGDLVFVQLPDKEMPVETKQEIAVVESVKAASDVYAPISGKIIACNEALESKPELINSAPYTEGWICKIAPSDPSEIGLLLAADDYAEQIA